MIRDIKAAFITNLSLVIDDIGLLSFRAVYKAFFELRLPPT